MAADLLGFVRQIAADAGALLKEGAGRAHAAGSKAAAVDLVTEYDRRSEALLVDAVRRAFPGDLILAEEGGASGGAGGAQRRWLIDPLDGTTNFAHGLPFFCVSVGVEEAGQLVAG